MSSSPWYNNFSHSIWCHGLSRRASFCSASSSEPSLSQKGWVPSLVKSLKLVPVKKPKFHCFFFFANKHTESVTCFLHSFPGLKGRMSTLPALPTFFLPSLVQGRVRRAALTSAFDSQSVFSTSCLLTTSSLPPPCTRMCKCLVVVTLSL